MLFHADLLEEGLAPATADHHAKLIRQMLNMAVEWEVIPSNPVSRIKLFNAEAQRQSRFMNLVVDAMNAGLAVHRLELVLAEESSHKLTETTSLRQKFALYPDLRDSGKYRAVFDTGLTVAMTQSLNLSAGLSYRYDSDPGGTLRKGDAMFVTGVSLRLD